MIDKLKKAFQNLLNKPKEDIKIGAIKEAISNIIQISLSKKEIDEISEKLFYDLLEADVPYEVAGYIKNQIIRELSQRKFTNNYKEEIKVILKDILKQYLSIGKIEKEKAIIMLIGPNGYGKTTTAVKLGYYFKNQGKKAKIIGADVFRAAAREQLAELAKRYNIDYYIDSSERPLGTIYKGLNDKENYDYIIIDTAGRQEMNINLLKELKAIQDKISPDYVFYVLESSVGNSVLHQLREYKRFLRVDGVVYTKMDLDSAGGSILGAGYYGFPIFFITNGQKIQDIEVATEDKIIARILE